MTGLSLPPTVPASANSIVAQFRAHPIDSKTSDHSHYCIPPMSIIMSTESDADLKKPARDNVRNAAAHHECGTINGALGAVELHRFRGVSIGGLSGRQAHGSMTNDRFTAIIRGEATIMVDHAAIETISIGDYVGIQSTDKFNTFQNFEACPTIQLNKAANATEAIGILIRKPDPRRPENWATVHLL